MSHQEPFVPFADLGDTVEMYFWFLSMGEIFLEMYFRFLISEFLLEMYFRFLISEFLLEMYFQFLLSFSYIRVFCQVGQEICFPKTEFSYKRVSCFRVFVIHNKEEFGRGEKIRWQ